jgi:multiple sugar transport system ATP-binding protein
MVYVTHDQVEAMTMASRIVVLNRGRIEQVGAPLDLYANPDNLFVAGFLGAPRMNFVAGEVIEANGSSARVACPGGLEATFATLPGEIRRGEAVTLGIRPEKLRFDDPSASIRFSGRVKLTEYLGRETVVYVDAGRLATTGSDSGTNVFTVQIGDIRPVHNGSTVSVGFDPADAYLFSADGRTITPPKAVAKI